MKIAVAVIVVAFVVLVAVTFVPPPDAEFKRASLYFTETEIATGLQFAFERRCFFWASTALELALLLGLVTTGAGRALADYFGRWTGYRADSPSEAPPGGKPSRMEAIKTWFVPVLRWLATLLLVGATYAVLHEMLQFPLNVGRFFHSRAWGMTERPFGEWVGEYWLSVSVTLAFEAVAGVGLYLLFRLFPRTWFLLGTGGGMLMAFATAFLLPVLIAPLFNTFTPLSRTEWAALEPRVRYLTEKAGIPVDEVYVMDASRQGIHTNAYFTGVGSTQSIVLYDNLLKKHPPAEVESILAHEIGHWAHRHIINGILLGSLAALVGLIVLDRIIRRFVARPPLHLTGLSDPAGLPLVILLVFVGSWVAMPLENRVSRYFEKQADEMSLELAGMPDVFIDAEKRLARDNKGNVVPAPWNVWLFSTHPSTIERIEMAEKWR